MSSMIRSRPQDLVGLSLPNLFCSTEDVEDFQVIGFSQVPMKRNEKVMVRESAGVRQVYAAGGRKVPQICCTGFDPGSKKLVAGSFQIVHRDHELPKGRFSPAIRGDLVRFRRCSLRCRPLVGLECLSGRCTTKL